MRVAKQVHFVSVPTCIFSQALFLYFLKINMLKNWGKNVERLRQNLKCVRYMLEGLTSNMCYMHMHRVTKWTWLLIKCCSDEN